MGFGGYDGSIKIDTKLDTGNIEKSLGSLGQSVKKGFTAVGIGVAAGLGGVAYAVFAAFDKIFENFQRICKKVLFNWRKMG